MDDLGGGGGGGGGGEVCRRQRFTVELRPGETTIVSWKKLVRDAARAAGEVATSATAAAVQPPVVDSRLAPGQPAENELKDGHPSRFGAVIEKIERLYMGNHSSEEEDLNDVPDDDEYDTEDSFIDDTELDNYFQVDNSAIKHDGFFVNRGKLERINKPTSLPSPQQKKRRRKDLVNTNGDEGELPNKLVKVGNKVAGKSKKLVDRNIGIPHVVALPSVHNEEMKYQDQTTTSTISAKKRSTETKASLDPFISSNVSNNDAALSMIRTVDRQNPEILTPENQGSKSKDGVKTPNALVLKSHDKSVAAQSKSEPAILSSSNGKLDQYVQCRKKDVIHDRPNLNVSAGKVPMQNAKTAVVQRKVDSIIKPKSTGLGKTIEELEKMVAESIPRSTEVQDDDVTSQATGKRRLPREVKQKLAKVARLAQASYGRIPDELVNQLMGILGHVVQMRTLKRNLKDMVAMGLTAKKEKDDRMQQMTKDVAELIRLRVPYMKSKVLEHQAGQSGDFQEMAKEEQEIIKRKYGMDDAIEDKISDLYDLYVNGLDEDAGPQARKLYAELANLWPKGFMDNHGIKRAICRSKDRKRALWGRSKDQEKIKQKKLVAKTEGTVRVETSTVSQPHHMQEKPVSEPNTHSLTLNNKPVSKTKQTNSSVKIASSSPQTSNPLHPNQDKVKAKGSSSINLNEKDKMDVLAKKKMKRKPERELVGGQSRMEKPASLSGDEKVKSHKQVAAGPLQKPSVYTSPPLNLKN